MTEDKLVIASCEAQDIADNANVAYWLESHGIDTRNQAREIDTKFRQLAETLGYVVYTKVEIDTKFLQLAEALGYVAAPKVAA